MNTPYTFVAKRKHRSDDSLPPSELKFMSNSERGKYYRRRNKLYNAQLEKRVTVLRDEIAALSVSRQVQLELTLSQRRTPLGAAASIVNEYCLLFKQGVPVSLDVDEQEVSASLVAHVSNAQRGFLQAVMNTNLRFGEFSGVDLLLGQWERYSLYHAAIHWTMKSLEVIELTDAHTLTVSHHCNESPLMITFTADLHVRFTRRTIKEVFPHLIGNEALTQLLIGLDVTYPCMNHFYFNQNGKIEWYSLEVDFIGALTRELKHPELVTHVMGNALIENDHFIGNTNNGRHFDIVKKDDEYTRTTNVQEAIRSSFREEDVSTTNLWSTNDSKFMDVTVVSDDELISEFSFSNGPKRLALSYILATK